MLVEDDKSLREIYGVRLLAEGYDIVSAGDGEEALAMAIKERPTLIVSDVMMPKISGFDMLDILRSTTETKNIKIIMMTALSSEEQRLRGESLGADRYLVKSQVGIEDVIRVVHEVLGDGVGPAAPSSAPIVAPAPPAAAIPPAPQLSTNPQQPLPPPQSPPPSPSPAPTPPPTSTPPASAPSTPPQNTPSTMPTPGFRPSPPTPPLSPPPMRSSSSPAAPSTRNRIIQPINDPGTTDVDINDLLDKELAKEAGVDMNARPPVASIDQERALIDDQISQFKPPVMATPPDTSAKPVPEINITPSGEISGPPAASNGNNTPQQPSNSSQPPQSPPPPAS